MSEEEWYIADSKKAPPAPFLHWWVVQDDSALPRPSGRRRRRLRCLTSFDSNLLQVRIFYIADSKKAPLGRFFTLVGRAG